MWISMRRAAGQKKWRHARQGARPSDYSTLGRGPGGVRVELAEIAHVEVTSIDPRTLTLAEAIRIARAILERMATRGRVRRTGDPGRVSRFPVELVCPTERGPESTLKA